MDTQYASGKSLGRSVTKMIQYRNKGATEGEECDLCHTNMKVGTYTCPRCGGIRELAPKGFAGVILYMAVVLSIYPAVFLIFFVLEENGFVVWVIFPLIIWFGLRFMPMKVVYSFPPRDASEEKKL